MPDPIRVIIVHTHGFVRHGLRAVLDADPQFRVVGEADTGPDALRIVSQQRPAVVLLDSQLLDTSGLDLCRSIVGLAPRTAVIMMTACMDRELVDAWLQAGAAGCLVKDADTPQLRKHVLQAVQRRAAALTAAGDAPGDKPEQPGLAPETRLTPREAEMLRLLARGLASGEIAAELDLDPLLVKGQLEEIQLRLNARSLLEAVLLASGRGLL